MHGFLTWACRARPEMKCTREEMKAARIPLECAPPACTLLAPCTACAASRPPAARWLLTCLRAHAPAARRAPTEHPRRAAPVWRVVSHFVPGMAARWRDYCAHILIPLNKCRIDHYWLPWTCMDLKHAYEKCQFDECAAWPLRGRPPTGSPSCRVQPLISSGGATVTSCRYERRVSILEAQKAE